MFEKYLRQMVLPGFGQEGQAKLLNAKVLIIGAGGLGAPCALYLAGAGIGTIGIIDSDNVELHNIHRQVMYSSDDIGMPKVESAQKRLSSLNRDIKVIPHNMRFDNDSAQKLVSMYDFVVDASDNFPTKYLVNNVCVAACTPFSHAGVLQYQGQLMTVLPRKTACFQCVFPEPPDRSFIPTCHEVGVLNTIVGILGTFQANEVLKYFLGIGSLLTNQLLMIDAFSSSVRSKSIQKDPQCNCQK